MEEFELGRLTSAVRWPGCVSRCSGDRAHQGNLRRRVARLRRWTVDVRSSRQDGVGEAAAGRADASATLIPGRSRAGGGVRGMVPVPGRCARRFFAGATGRRRWPRARQRPRRTSTSRWTGRRRADRDPVHRGLMTQGVGQPDRERPRPRAGRGEPVAVRGPAQFLPAPRTLADGHGGQRVSVIDRKQGQVVRGGAGLDQHGQRRGQRRVHDRVVASPGPDRR